MRKRSRQPIIDQSPQALVVAQRLAFELIRDSLHDGGAALVARVPSLRDAQLRLVLAEVVDYAVGCNDLLADLTASTPENYLDGAARDRGVIP